MFAVVKILEYEHGFKAKLKYLLKKPLPQLEKISITPTQYFYYLKIYRQQCGDGYSEIARLLGRLSKRILPCDNRLFEGDTPLKTVTASGYHQILLLNSALDLLEKKDYDKTKYRVCLFDSSGLYAGYTQRLVSLANDVTVVTKRADKYEAAVRDVLRRFGASVAVRNALSNLSEYDAVISPDFSVNKAFNNSLLLRNGDAGCFDIFRGYDIHLPEQIGSVMPEGVNKLDFAYALYRFCSAGQLGELTYCDFKSVGNIR